jgi:hypothetical protein
MGRDQQVTCDVRASGLRFYKQSQNNYFPAPRSDHNGNAITEENNRNYDKTYFL